MRQLLIIIAALVLVGCGGSSEVDIQNNDVTTEKEVFNFQPEGQLDLFSENGGKQIKVKHIGDTPKAGGTLINKKYTHKKAGHQFPAVSICRV